MTLLGVAILVALALGFGVGFNVAARIAKRRSHVESQLICTDCIEARGADNLSEKYPSLRWDNLS